MSKLLNSINEIEALLRSTQSRNTVPRFICYWADGSVTQGSEYEPVRMAMDLLQSEHPANIIVGVLNPYGQFMPGWSLDGEYAVTYGDSGAFLSREYVTGLSLAIAKMVEGQGSWCETKTATVSRDKEESKIPVPWKQTCNVCCGNYMATGRPCEWCNEGYIQGSNFREMNLALLTSWVRGSRKSLEWSVGDRTFQICGVRGSEGCFERFFSRGLHPTRRSVADAEVLEALANATGQIKFWRNEEDQVFFENAEAALEAAKQWISQTS